MEFIDAIDINTLNNKIIDNEYFKALDDINDRVCTNYDKNFKINYFDFLKLNDNEKKKNINNCRVTVFF